MKTHLTVSLSLLVGIAIGATAVGGLKAQGKGPAYVIADFSEVSDLAALVAGSKGMPGAVAAGGGKVLARSDTVIGLDGTPPKRLAIVQFESVDKAKAWFTSDAMKEPEVARKTNTKSRLFVVEGLPN